MYRTGNKRLTGYSQELRKNMTPEERHLWYDFLKNLPITVNRQKVIGPYIVDFYCAKAKLVIELDGVQHSEPEQYEYDRKRDAYLTGLGFDVIRYGNYDINTNFYGVCDGLLQIINSKLASPMVFDDEE